jgi:hypothetical protein
MDALVIVESVFGNTRRIAESVAQGLGPRVHARVVDVSEAAGLVEGADLLVVGGPTHAFGMSRPSTRRSASEQAGDGAVPAGIGLREFVAGLPRAGRGRMAAAFDTRVDRPRLPGSAAAAALRRLRGRGYERVSRAESFRVVGTKGPLIDGELERARRWGSVLAARVMARAADRGGDERWYAGRRRASSGRRQR